MHETSLVETQSLIQRCPSMAYGVISPLNVQVTRRLPVGCGAIRLTVRSAPWRTLSVFQPTCVSRSPVQVTFDLASSLTKPFSSGSGPSIFCVGRSTELEVRSVLKLSVTGAADAAAGTASAAAVAARTARRVIMVGRTPGERGEVSIGNLSAGWVTAHHPTPSITRVISPPATGNQRP